MANKLTLFYSPGSCSIAPHIVLEEIAVDYELVPIILSKNEQRAPEFLAKNPKGRVPAIADGSWVLTEGPAILRFLARRHPEANLWPDDLAEEARCAEWLAWIASTIHIAFAHVARPYRWATDPQAREDVIATGKTNCREQWTAVERALPDDAPWALGARYSVVDPYLLVFWLFGRGARLAFDMETMCPKWTAHARRMAARPAVRRTFEQEQMTLPS